MALDRSHGSGGDRDVRHHVTQWRAGLRPAAAYNRRMQNQDEVLSAAVRARLQQAREEVTALMAARGLSEKDGWRIHEEMRSTIDGTQWVLRPVHMHRDAPGVEAVVTIDASGCPL
jgi:hypothetical protein